MANSVVHFEIPADDVARAQAFYQKIFGWSIKRYPMPGGDEYFGVQTRKAGEPGIDGGMMLRKMPNQPFTAYIDVASIDAVNERVQASGGTIILPKQSVGQGMGSISLFKDPENNVIGLWEAAPAAPTAAPARKKAPPRKKAPARKAAAKKPAAKSSARKGGATRAGAKKGGAKKAAARRRR